MKLGELRWWSYMAIPVATLAWLRRDKPLCRTLRKPKDRLCNYIIMIITVATLPMNSTVYLIKLSSARLHAYVALGLFLGLYRQNAHVQSRVYL